MKGLQVWLTCVAAAGVCLYFLALHMARRAEIDVTTAVAEVFMRSAKSGDSATSLSVASKHYQERFADALSKDEQGVLASDRQYYDLTQWIFAEKYLSADHNQAILVGKFVRPIHNSGGFANTPTNKGEDPRLTFPKEEIAFRVILIKESGLWRVDAVTWDPQRAGSR